MQLSQIKWEQFLALRWQQRVKFKIKKYKNKAKKGKQTVFPLYKMPDNVTNYELGLEAVEGLS